MVRAVCPHCGGSIDVCIASGEIRRIQLISAAAATVTVAQNVAEKARRLALTPEAVLHTMEASKALDEAYKALLDDIDREEE